MKKKIFLVILVLVIICLTSVISINIYKIQLDKKNEIIKKYANSLNILRLADNYEISYYNDQYSYKKIYRENEILIYEVDKNSVEDKIIYYDGNGNETLINNIDKTVYQNNYEKGLSFFPVSIINSFLVENYPIEIKDIKEDSFKGKECYVLSRENSLGEVEKVYIDKENYNILGFINEKGLEFICEIKYNTVESDDFELPELSEYTNVN